MNAGVNDSATSGTSPRTYGGSTLQERKARRRAALIETALDLLSEGGVERVTVSGVSAKARLNDRYFYESFRDRDELLHAAVDDMIAAGVQAMADTVSGFAGLDTATATSTAIEAAVEFFTANSRYSALLIASQRTEGLQARREELVRTIASVVTAQATELLGDDAPSPDDLHLAAFTLVSGAVELMTTWLRGDLDVTRDRLIDTLSAVFIASTRLRPADFSRRTS